MRYRNDTEGAVRVALDSLPEPLRRLNESAFHRLTSACGCAEGALGAVTLVTFVLGRFAYTFTHWSLFEVLLLTGQVSLAFLVGGFAGKSIGLAIARMRLRALCNRIRREARQFGS